MRISEGRKDDGGKLRYDLLDPEGLRGTVEVLTYGANKYTEFNDDGSVKVSGDRNWEKGISWERVYAALLRHLMAWQGGEDIDPESNLAHIDHAGCCIHFLQAYRFTHPELDDRPSSIKETVND